MKKSLDKYLSMEYDVPDFSEDKKDDLLKQFDFLMEHDKKRFKTNKDFEDFSQNLNFWVKLDFPKKNKYSTHGITEVSLKKNKDDANKSVVCKSYLFVSY